MAKKLSVPEKHQKKVALQTLKYSDVGASIMGGMTKDEARKFLKSIGYTANQIKKLDESVIQEISVHVGTNIKGHPIKGDANQISYLPKTSYKAQKKGKIYILTAQDGYQYEVEPSEFKKLRESTDYKIRSIIRSAISEYLSGQEEESDNVDDEIDKTDIEEISGTGGVAGYQTPAAFVGQGGKERKKKWLDKVNKIIGYEQVWDEEDADQLGSGAKKMSNYVGTNESLNEAKKFNETTYISGSKYKGGVYDGQKVKVNVGSDAKPRWVSGKISMVYSTRLTVDDGKKLINVDKKDYHNDDKIKYLKEGRRGAYHEYRDDDSKTTRQKLGYSIREIRNQLREIEKKIDLNYKLKTETGIANADYWKGTRTALGRLAEIMNRLQHKIRRF